MFDSLMRNINILRFASDHDLVVTAEEFFFSQQFAAFVSSCSEKLTCVENACMKSKLLSEIEISISIGAKAKLNS